MYIFKYIPMVVSFMSPFFGEVHLSDPTVQVSKTGMQTGAMPCLERGSDPKMTICLAEIVGYVIDIFMWVKQCHEYKPSPKNISIFIGFVSLPFPVMAGLWNCFTHIISIYIPHLWATFGTRIIPMGNTHSFVPLNYK